MNKVNTDKKLELIKSIRMQNQYNRQVFRSREGFLYSDEPMSGRGELYSLEEEAKTQMQNNGKIYGSFRIRFVIAAALFLAFILCDINHISYMEENTDTLFGRMVSNADIAELLHIAN